MIKSFIFIDVHKTKQIKLHKTKQTNYTKQNKFTMDRSEMMNHFIETIINKIEKKKAVDTNKLTMDEKLVAQIDLFNWIEAARTLKTSKLDTDSFSFAKKLAEEDDILEYVNDQNFHIIQSHLDQGCITAFQSSTLLRFICYENNRLLKTQQNLTDFELFSVSRLQFHQIYQSRGRASRGVVMQP